MRAFHVEQCCVGCNLPWKRSAEVMAKKKAKKTATRTATAPANKAMMVVTLYNGTRQPIQGKDFLIRIFDGFQNQLFDDFKPAPTETFNLPFHDNLQDNCVVVATGKGHVDAGFSPVKLSNKVVATVDLMLLEDKGDFKFPTWAAVQKSDPVVSGFISVGGTDAEAQTHYDALRQTKPAALASLLNLATAMKAIQLPSKKDRFFGYADKSIVDQVRRAVMEGEFRPEPNPGLFHPDATSSFKQIQFGEANVQLTFHEKDIKTIDGVNCVKIEPDIDYFQDLGAHTLLEVIPNSITHGLTDPNKVYVLRWIAGRHAGVPEFAPPYTIQSNANDRGGA
jgi:hypothetical protein